MALAMTVEGVLAIVGTLSFISFLSGSSIKDISKSQSALVGKEIFRIGIIAISNVISIVFGIWIVFDDNYINHTAFYLPTLTYSLELYCFLDLSYNIAREIVSEQKVISSAGDSNNNLSNIAHDYSDYKQNSRGKDSTARSDNQFPPYDHRNQFAPNSVTDSSPKNHNSKPSTRYKQSKISVSSSITDSDSISPRNQKNSQYDYRSQYGNRN